VRSHAAKRTGGKRRGLLSQKKKRIWEERKESAGRKSTLLGKKNAREIQYIGDRLQPTRRMREEPSPNPKKNCSCDGLSGILRSTRNQKWEGDQLQNMAERKELALQSN